MTQRVVAEHERDERVEARTALSAWQGSQRRVAAVELSGQELRLRVEDAVLSLHGCRVGEALDVALAGRHGALVLSCAWVPARGSVVLQLRCPDGETFEVAGRRLRVED